MFCTNEERFKLDKIESSQKLNLFLEKYQILK